MYILRGGFGEEEFSFDWGPRSADEYFDDESGGVRSKAEGSNFADDADAEADDEEEDIDDSCLPEAVVMLEL